MRIVLLGAGGFIGRHILAELLTRGHEVTAIVRKSGGLATAFPQARFVEMDLAQVPAEGDWLPLLQGKDYVINAAGLLQGRYLDAVHVDMPRALYAAARRSGVRHAILISAISAREDVKTQYSLSKLAGERELRTSGLEWTVLRPSLVYGDGSYGGTSLIRGLAGLPFAVPLPGTGEYRFTPIHVQDLARATATMCGEPRYFGQVLEPVGPETLTLRELLARYRHWLGFGVLRAIHIPMPLMRLMGRIGDLARAGPMSSTSVEQMVAGNDGDAAAYEKAVGFRQRSLDQALAERPAQVQDRWHARLFFLAPATKAVLVLLWIVSALLGLFYGAARTAELTASLGLSSGWNMPLQWTGSLIDLGVAALVMLEARARWSTAVQLIIVLGYTTLLTVALPDLWLDPLGPLLKNLPVLLLIAVHGVIGDRR